MNSFRFPINKAKVNIASIVTFFNNDPRSQENCPSRQNGNELNGTLPLIKIKLWRKLIEHFCMFIEHYRYELSLPATQKGR